MNFRFKLCTSCCVWVGFKDFNILVRTSFIVIHRFVRGNSLGFPANSVANAGEFQITHDYKFNSIESIHIIMRFCIVFLSWSEVFRIVRKSRNISSLLIVVSGWWTTNPIKNIIINIYIALCFEITYEGVMYNLFPPDSN